MFGKNSDEEHNSVSLEKSEEDSQMPKKNCTCRMKTIFILSLVLFLGVFGITGSAIADGSTDITGQALIVP